MTELSKLTGPNDTRASCDAAIVPIFPVRFALKANTLLDILDSDTTPPAPWDMDAMDHHELVRIRRGYVYILADGDFQVFRFETLPSDENGAIDHPETDLPPTEMYQFYKYAWEDGTPQGYWSAETRRYPYAFVPYAPSNQIPKAWIAYSEHRWPYSYFLKAKGKDKESFDFRQALMTEIDLISREGHACKPITDLAKYVPAFRKADTCEKPKEGEEHLPLEDYDTANAIRHTNVDLEYASKILDCPHTQNKGVLVALHDPVGELQDINALMAIHADTTSNFIAEHQYPLAIGAAVKPHADSGKVEAKPQWRGGELADSFAAHYQALTDELTELQKKQTRLVAHWANKAAQTSFGTVGEAVRLNLIAANSYSFKAHPRDHTETVAYGHMHYARLSSNHAHSEPLSASLASLFDPSKTSAPNAATLLPMAENLKKILDFTKHILTAGDKNHQRALAPAINTVFTVYGTEIVQAATAGNRNATEQITALIYGSGQQRFHAPDQLQQAFRGILSQEGYSSAGLPSEAQILGNRITAQTLMNGPIDNPSHVGVIEFYAQVDLELDADAIEYAKRANNFELSTNGIGLVAGALSLGITLAKLNETRRDVTTIGAIASHPSTQLIAAFGDAYSSLHGLAGSMIIGRGNAGAVRRVTQAVFGNRALLQNAATSNSIVGRAVASKSLQQAARATAFIGIAISVAQSIEGIKRGDAAMAVGNGLTAIASIGLLFFATGPIALILIALVITGAIISLFALDDIERWVLDGFWGRSGIYWKDKRFIDIDDQIQKGRALGKPSHTDHKETKEFFEAEIAHYLDISSTLTITKATGKSGVVAINCATLQRSSDIQRLSVTVRYDPGLFSLEQTISTTPQWVKPGVAYIHIPQRDYDGANEFEVEATLERIPNGNFNEDHTFTGRELW